MRLLNPGPSQAPPEGLTHPEPNKKRPPTPNPTFPLHPNPKSYDRCCNPSPLTLLVGSWVVISGVISSLIWVIRKDTLLITPLITTHEPPSIDLTPKFSSPRAAVPPRWPQGSQAGPFSTGVLWQEGVWPTRTLGLGFIQTPRFLFQNQSFC